MSTLPAPGRKRIAIAGATGFVGRALIQALSARHDVVALTRQRAETTRVEPGAVEWRACDLFSLRDSERALRDIDAAFYLVHSMMPSAGLTQASFEDMDLLCADNFARAAQSNGVGHIVYLGGLLPPVASAEGGHGELSRHLESRLEVEKTLGAHGVPVTTLRAGLVVGAGGSSFDMMIRLVGRLPFMVGPRWTRSMSQAIALRDVVSLLVFALDNPQLAGKAYDVGCPDVLSYADMLRLTGRTLHRTVHILTLPVRTAKLSLLWVSVITGAPRQLVQPLLESLRHDLVAHDGLVLQREAGLTPLPLREALELALREKKAREAALLAAPPAAPVVRPKVRGDSRVRSVQRLPLPPGRDARWVAAEYASWLPHFLPPFLRVQTDEANNCRFFFWPLRLPLLELSFAAERSTSDRQLFFVTGGLLARVHDDNRARLEFRTVMQGRFVLAAIHEFAPRLPWFIYRYTQALVHLLVMRRFGRHLGRIARRPADVPVLSA